MELIYWDLMLLLVAGAYFKFAAFYPEFSVPWYLFQGSAYLLASASLLTMVVLWAAGEWGAVRAGA